MPLHQLSPGVDAFPLLHERDFLRIADLAHRAFGLDLRDGKQAFVAARLSRLVRELGLASFREYCDYLIGDRSGAALIALADRLTTNHTAFFREPEHFEFLRRSILPTLRSRDRIDIWSAGCSSGEEPYSIAISLLETAPHLGTRTRIHATDISTRMLQRAAAAVYSADRLTEVPPAFRDRHFIPAAEPHSLRIAPLTRGLVDVGRLNLFDAFPVARYSVIFCRNVMLYFDRPAHQSLVQRLTAHLEPGGFLFIGHSESLSDIDHCLEHAAPAVYRKPIDRCARPAMGKARGSVAAAQFSLRNAEEVSA